MFVFPDRSFSPFPELDSKFLHQKLRGIFLHLYAVHHEVAHWKYPNFLFCLFMDSWTVGRPMNWQLWNPGPLFRPIISSIRKLRSSILGFASNQSGLWFEIDQTTVWPRRGIPHSSNWAVIRSPSVWSLVRPPWTKSKHSVMDRPYLKFHRPRLSSWRPNLNFLVFITACLPFMFILKLELKIY